MAKPDKLEIDRETIVEMRAIVDGAVANLQTLEKRLRLELELIGRITRMGQTVSDMLRQQLPK